MLIIKSTRPSRGVPKTRPTQAPAEQHQTAEQYAERVKLLDFLYGPDPAYGVPETHLLDVSRYKL